MDAAETPVRGDLYQVRPLVAVRHHVVDVLVKVQCVLAVSKVSVVLAVERKVKEGLIKVKAVVAMSVVAVTIWLGVISLPVSVIIGTSVFTGQDLDYNSNKYEYDITSSSYAYFTSFIRAYMHITLMMIKINTNLIGFGNLDKHVLSTWIFVFVRMP